MTTITYKRYPKASLTIEGHSLAPRVSDHDLCCAAVSMLSCTIMQRIHDLALNSKAIYSSDAYVHIEFAPLGKNGRRGMEALNTVITGFKLLGEKYPDNIKITGGKNE